MTSITYEEESRADTGRRYRRAIRVTIRSAAAEAWSNRSAFWSQVTAMVVNDLAWVGFWVLFFDRVGAIRGWDVDRVLLLWAVLTTSAGLTLGLLSNARRIGQYATGGELDAVLALPVPPLAYLLVRRIETTNLGDFLFGVILFAVTGTPTLERTAIYVVCVLSGTVLLTGFLVATGSLAFFGGRGEAGDFGLHAILLLSSYPADIFTGAAKALLYTAVPAAFVSAVPSTLIDDFDPTRAAAMLGAAAFFAVLGWALFTLGLRRYTSGSVWTRA
jgi:ABC-2 type transport system permease protein